MNERIKELAEQAENYAEDNFRGEPTWSEAFDSKFAELIVRECMEQVWYTREDVINDNVSQVIKDRIKQHLGVEE
jgi:hypothetical protein